MPTDNPLVNWLVGIVAGLIALVWWDMKRRLQGIDVKLDNVTTTVERHNTVLEFHGREIERLRGEP